MSGWTTTRVTPDNAGATAPAFCVSAPKMAGTNLHVLETSVPPDEKSGVRAELGVRVVRGRPTNLQ